MRMLQKRVFKIFRKRRPLWWNIILLVILLEVGFLFFKGSNILQSSSNTKYRATQLEEKDSENDDTREDEIVEGNYFGHVVNRVQHNARNQLKGVKSKWISAKKWWYSKVVLQQYDLPQFSDSSVNNKSNQGTGVDFEYNWPRPDTFAYVWYATNQAEFCSVLMAMKRLKKLRKEQFGGNKAYTNNNDKRPRKVDYVLVFAGSKKGDESSEKEDNDESYLYLDNMVKERITQIWTREGGSIGGNNLEPNDPMRSNPLLMAYNLKSEAYTYDFTSIILMEPAGIPLKTMDELFNVYSTGVGEGVSGHNILNAPEATGRELEGIDIMRKIRVPRCFGKLAKPVSTAVMSYQPAKSFKNRMKHSFNKLSLGNLERVGAKQRSIISRFAMPDVMVVNQEFACNDEINILPHTYATTDSDFRQEVHQPSKTNKLIQIDEVSFLHFNNPNLRPWHGKYKDKMYPNLPTSVKHVIEEWLDEAKEVCEFVNPEDWNEDVNTSNNGYYQDQKEPDYKTREYDTDEELKDRVKFDDNDDKEHIDDTRDNHLIAKEDDSRKMETNDRHDGNWGWRQPYGGGGRDINNYYPSLHDKENLKPNEDNQQFARIAQQHQDMANDLAKKKGVDVKPAKGGMFDDLGEVARHLQRIGAKLDPPNDPEMANILEQYGVVNKQIDPRDMLEKQIPNLPRMNMPRVKSEDDIEFERKESMLNNFEDGGRQMKNEHQLRAQQLAQEKGVDVQPAKGGMFNNLEDVAMHLQKMGEKLDVPNDPQMAEILGRFGVLKNSGMNDDKSNRLRLPDNERVQQRNPMLNQINHQRPKFNHEQERFAQNDGPGRLDLRNFDLNNLVEEKMYIKPSGEIQIANG